MLYHIGEYLKIHRILLLFLIECVTIAYQNML